MSLLCEERLRGHLTAHPDATPAQVIFFYYRDAALSGRVPWWWARQQLWAELRSVTRRRRTEQAAAQETQMDYTPNPVEALASREAWESLSPEDQQTLSDVLDADSLEVLAAWWGVSEEGAKTRRRRAIDALRAAQKLFSED